MTKIETGDYYIKNLSSGKYVGRTLDEDTSLLPKPIVNLPEQFVGQSRFHFEKRGDNEYRISVQGAATAAIDEKLFAVLLPEPPSGIWKLTHDERTGGNNFVIFDARDPLGKGWDAMNKEDFAQVRVEIIPTGDSIPPYYSPDCVWVIELAKDPR